MRRTPAATALSYTTFTGRYRRSRAHACRRKARRKSARALIAVARLAHGNHAHFLAIFLAEQRHRTGLDGSSRPSAALRRGFLADDRVDQVSTLASSSFEPPSDGRNRSAASPDRPASPLRDMRAKRLAQRLMQKMGCRMVGAGGRAPRLSTCRSTESPTFSGPFSPRPYARRFSRASSAYRSRRSDALGPHDDADIANLAAGLAIERRLVDDDDAFLALLRCLTACRP